MSSGVVYMTKLDSSGLPSEPPEARKAFKRASGFQVRDNVPITFTDWRQVPAAIKDNIRSNMKEKIKFSAGAEDVVKNVMFINMGRLFCKWKSKLNRKYMKKGLMPSGFLECLNWLGPNHQYFLETQGPEVIFPNTQGPWQNLPKAQGPKCKTVRNYGFPRFIFQ
jgi:hypothetical protein